MAAEIIQDDDVTGLENRHKLLLVRNSAVLRRMIRAAGARLWYLPPYSPDLNPIEQTFAKIKYCMRMAQKRIVNDTWRHIGDIVATIRPSECSHYFANAGYASIKI